MRRYIIISAVLAASVLVLGCFLYYLQNQVGTLSQEMKSLSRELNDTRQAFNGLNSLTLRTFNFTIVLSNTVTSQYNGVDSWSWGESAALEDATMVSAGDTASTLSLSDLITGSRPLDVYGLGFPFATRWVSYLPPPPTYTGDPSDYYHTIVKVDTLGYGFYNVAVNATQPVTHTVTHDNQSETIGVARYTFTGQVSLLYSTLAGNATFYLTLHPDGQLSMIESNVGWYKVVPLPP